MTDDENKPNPESSREDVKGDLRDSLSKRLESPKKDSNRQLTPSDNREQSDSSNKRDKRDKRDQNAKKEKHEKLDKEKNRAKRDTGDRWVSAQNVKQEWENVLMYLPDSTVRSELNDGWSRCQLNYNLDLKKTRHYYPAVLLAGLDAIEDMSQEEFEALLEEIESE